MKPGDMVRVKNPHLRLYRDRVFLCLDQHLPMWYEKGDPPTHINVLDSNGCIIGFYVGDLEVIQ